MTTLIIGLGSIGRRHAQVIKSISPDERLIALRSGRGASPQGCSDIDQEVFSWEDALSQKLDCAIVANPAPQHIAMATTLVENGLHVMIEKPLSVDMEGIFALRELAQQKGLTVNVGYNLRFHPGLVKMRNALTNGEIGALLSVQAEVGQNLGQWRPDCEAKTSISASSNTGGGVIFELSHELDYVHWLMGDVTEIQAMEGRLGTLVNDVEDIVNIQCRFSSGALGHIHIDMLSHVLYRFCRVIGETGLAEWNAITGESRIFSQSENAWRVLQPAGPPDRNATFAAQWKQFQACINGSEAPNCSLEDGRITLELCLAVKQSIKTGGSVHL